MSIIFPKLKVKRSSKKKKKNLILLIIFLTAPPTTVVGKLIEKAEFWENGLEASPYVLNVVKHGYKLPFEEKVSAFYAKNNSSSLRNTNFVTKSINELLEQNCIEEVSEMSYCCNPLTVAEGKKLRFSVRS